MDDPRGNRRAHDSKAGPAWPCLPPAAQPRERGLPAVLNPRAHPGWLRAPPTSLPPPPPQPGEGLGAGPAALAGCITFALPRTRPGSGGMAQGLLPLLLVSVLITETQCKNYTEAVTRVAHNKLIKRRIIAKREIKCNLDEYNSGVKCCKKCEPGFVKNIDCPTNISKHCVPCENGKEYINHVNDLEKCLRCTSCDRTFGLEVAKNCTPVQNTECVCAKNYFCNSSLPCTHCDACTICESGMIEKQCTPSSDTVCRSKGKPLWIIGPIIMLLAIAGIFWYWRKRKSRTSKQNQNEVVPRETPYTEFESLNSKDVDLSSHVACIVGEMTLQEIKIFVRHHGVSEPVIDQTVQDYINDSYELKVKLFQVWYQEHGIKGAYRTLIRSLRELKMCAAADKIEDKLKPILSKCQEGGQPDSDDAEQSKTYAQESTNSYNDNAEQSKTYSNSLEETQHVNI
ncbi:tumor necrosis factor receptor superfamily member 6 [Calypte anna]|uniref:tumor necrosis factor receptor superfamily member 6 n=1 Tax=Calypte anna TaxID=9244 RepID=UPI0011C3AB86|nr:tumor necrosis factor receptor superfamily member 6 [Calypte anna]